MEAKPENVVMNDENPQVVEDGGGGGGGDVSNIKMRCVALKNEISKLKLDIGDFEKSKVKLIAEQIELGEQDLAFMTFMSEWHNG